MAKSECPCGTAYVCAVFVRATYDEWALPIDVVAFRSCDEVHAFLDAMPPEAVLLFCVEVMSSSLNHHKKWLERFANKSDGESQQ